MSIILNGLTLPISADSLSEKTYVIGADTTSSKGTFNSSVVARKREWAFEVPFRSQAMADFYKNFINGSGRYWSFDSGLWSDYGGIGPNAGYTAAQYSGTPKFGTSGDGQRSCQLNPSGTTNGGMTITVPECTSWTLCYYLYTGDASWSQWNHIVTICDNGTITTYRNGANYSSAVLANVSVSTSGGYTSFTFNGRLVLAATWSASVWLDDLVICPYAWDSSFVSTHYNYAGTTTAGTSTSLAFGNLPRLKMTGLYTTTVRGFASDATYTKGVVSSSWSTVRSLRVTLREV